MRDRALEPKISRRQLQALEQARLGRGPREVARIWKTSAANAEDAFAEARRKVSARNTEEAIDRAISLGLLQPLPVSTRVPFSARQLDVLEFLTRGCSRREIGEELGISKGAVGHYIWHMRAKVRARDDDELLGVAEQLGIVKRNMRRVARRKMQQVKQREAIPLTERQKEVAEAICRWKNISHEHIAARLGVTRGTIDHHVRVLKHRLNLAGTTRSEFAERYHALVKASNATRRLGIRPRS